MNSHWKYKFINPNWVQIWCPTFHNINPKTARAPFSLQKQIWIELKTLESRFRADPMIFGWIQNTKLHHTHIMLLYTKIGAYPYYIDRKLKKIWFRKVLRGGLL